MLIIVRLTVKQYHHHDETFSLPCYPLPSIVVVCAPLNFGMAPFLRLSVPCQTYGITGKAEIA